MGVLSDCMMVEPGACQNYLGNHNYFLLPWTTNILCVWGDYGDYGGELAHHGVEREAFEHDYGASYDFGHYGGGFEYDTGFDYY